ncbi:hypothetical protein PIB30_092760 [Stylosanthes scabra]|uniref:non-specific serine/threonine protein kinase n=1 Tax=Stylosanthes scabra TaxID=79078 RepID=A0ABU6VWZ7_9FABA|nr:hypothetical protein [Stylosanthes scabra]
MLPFTFILTTFLLLFIYSQPSLSLNQEGLLLLQFKNHLTDRNNALSSWNPSDTTPCHWLGVTCRSTTKTPVTVTVTALNLSSVALIGPLPAIPLCRLPALTTLSIPDSYISDTIPQSLSACRRLRHLDLSQNTLVGTIPPSLSLLTDLRHLDLSFNNLSGDIPAQLSHLRCLEYLDLVSNFLDGPFPNSLTNVTSLKYLRLAYNLFAPSQLPSQLGQLANLKVLWLSSCNLIGPIPNSIGNLTCLENLDLSKNKLTGEIPESITGLNSVLQIELYENALTGALPRGLGNLTRLRQFDASDNKLTGTIPEELCELPLDSLNLYNNSLEGSLPASIARSPNLHELKLFRNELVGSLQSELGSNSQLQILDVSFNRFSGELPASLCRWGKLEELLMLSNSFSGKIPESLGNCTSLRRVRIGNNNLSGKVPDAFWGLPHLHLLELNSNSFSGSISNLISFAYNLSDLRISDNQFSGLIPDAIGSLSNLLEFHGGNNKLSGRFPDSIAKLIQLGTLDLSYNEMYGEIPGWIRGLNNLIELNLAHNSFGGTIPKELGSLSELTFLDLSNNQLSGEIPLELQNLKLNKFNLSYNQLSGDVPPHYATKNYEMSFIGNPELCVNESVKCLSSKGRHYRMYVWTFALAAILFILGVAVFYLRYRNFRNKKKGSNVSKWRSFHKLAFDEFEIVKLMSEENVIGSGSSGKVYKVVLSSGDVVAVKKLWGATNNGNRTGIVGSEKDEFDVEVETLGKIRHKNIVRLWCCCNSGDSRLLVYEYMPNGNLADMLKSSKKSLLDWPTRYKIAIDAAEGLSYLHHGIVPPIFHRDVKSNNILLDNEFGAKVADFGVAKVVREASQGAESMSVIAGSYGYIAPEYAYTLRVNEKSDIYSFGVVILELVTGKPPIHADYGENDLVKWVSCLLEQNGMDHVIDPSLDSKYREEISKVLNVGLLCTSALPINRPAMWRVVKMLKEAATVPKSQRVMEVTLTPYLDKETCYLEITIV